MANRQWTALAAAALLTAGLAASGPSQAHHAFAAEFDAQKAVKVQGVVTKVMFVNPHSWIYLDVKNPDGSVTNWGFEFGTPTTLRSHGLSREDVKPGTAIDIAGYKAKNGGPFGYSQVLTIAGGRSVKTGSAPDAPALRAALNAR